MPEYSNRIGTVAYTPGLIKKLKEQLMKENPVEESATLEKEFQKALDTCPPMLSELFIPQKRKPNSYPKSDEQRSKEVSKRRKRNKNKKTHRK